MYKSIPPPVYIIPNLPQLPSLLHVLTGKQCLYITLVNLKFTAFLWGGKRMKIIFLDPKRKACFSLTNFSLNQKKKKTPPLAKQIAEEMGLAFRTCPLWHRCQDSNISLMQKLIVHWFLHFKNYFVKSIKQLPLHRSSSKEQNEETAHLQTASLLLN